MRRFRQIGSVQRLSLIHICTGSNNGNTGNNTTNNGKPDKESKYESDLNKSTARVNSATGLKDGVYTPDSFSWSGGTGKVRISCSKVTVTGGQAYATITLDVYKRQEGDDK